MWLNMCSELQIRAQFRGAEARKQSNALIYFAVKETGRQAATAARTAYTASSAAASPASLLWLLLLISATAPSVTPAPVSCSGVSVSPSTKKPPAAANMGVRKVRLERAVRLPREAL